MDSSEMNETDINAGYESGNGSDVLIENTLMPTMHNGDGYKRATRQYSCKACFFSTLSLLQFLMHVEKMHFDCHTSKSDASIPDETPEPMRENSPESFTGKINEPELPEAHISSSEENIIKADSSNSEVPVPQLPVTTTCEMTVSKESQNKNCMIKQEFAHAGLSPLPPPASVQKSISSVPIQHNSMLPSNALANLQNMTNSVATYSQADPETRETCADPGNDNPSDVPSAISQRILQARIRGGKIDSIANSLKGYSAVKSFPPEQNTQCDMCGSFRSPNLEQCRNCAQIRQNNINSHPTQAQHFPTMMPSNMSQSFPYRQSNVPQFKPSISPKYPILTATANHLKRLYSHEGHYRNLQSLLSSGSVTMPHTQVLQSIKCERDMWKDIQETLHEAFSSFPYLTQRETLVLANMTGLTVQQVKTLFVVARLQHGISWDQDEIKNSRKYLGIPRNRFETCFPR